MKKIMTIGSVDVFSCDEGRTRCRLVTRTGRGHESGQGSFELACMQAGLSNPDADIVLHAISDEDAGKLMGLVGVERFRAIAERSGWKRIR